MAWRIELKVNETKQWQKQYLTFLEKNCSIKSLCTDTAFLDTSVDSQHVLLIALSCRPALQAIPPHIWAHYYLRIIIFPTKMQIF